MQHGLWGNSTNLEPLEQMLQEHCNTSLAASSLPVRTVNSPVNNEKLTYDGVHTCGLRLVQLIRDTAEALQQEGFRVAQLSFVGYSLGGLMARYAVGVLQHEGAFDGPNAYQPLNFVTISTPHLGAWRFSEQARCVAAFGDRPVHCNAPSSNLRACLRCCWLAAGRCEHGTACSMAWSRSSRL